MRKLITVLFTLFFFISLFPQGKEYVKFFKEGNNFLENEDYEDALTCFINAYKIDSTNANINFKIGCCYAELSHHRHLGERYFQKAITDVTKKYKENNPRFKKAPYFAYFYYAELLHGEDKLEESKKMFKIYETYVDPKKQSVDYELLAHYEDMVETAKEKEAHPHKIYISNLGDSINSPYAEYAPVCDGAEKTLIFTYRGDKSLGASEGLKTESGKYFEDIFMSTRLPNGEWSKAKPIKGINTKAHDASVSLSNDGNVLIVYKDDDGDGNLYYCERKGDEWGSLIKFGPEINSEYWEPSACFSADLTTLYFVSDRPGGFGGRDIYKCKMLPNGKWSEPLNLGPKINTKYDEESPFLHANGKDFFFSSNGHKSMGGFVIMSCQVLENNDFSQLNYFPFPINTTGDDLFYFVSPDGRRAYYSTSHYDTIGKGDNDIYVFSLDEFNNENNFFAHGGFELTGAAESSSDLAVKISSASTGNEIGRYAPAKNGEFIAVLPLDSMYKVTYFSKKDTINKQIIKYNSTDSSILMGREVYLKKTKLKQIKKEDLVKKDTVKISVDTDKDGLLDKDDRCFELPGPVENFGCPWPDSDMDGIRDSRDSCPDIVGPVFNKGCPLIKDNEIFVIEQAFSHLEFATGKDIILSSSFVYLDDLVKILKQHKKDWRVKLAGHTDSEGDHEINLVLSEKRAKSVMNYLVKKGIPADKFVIEWYGDTKPVADNLTSTGKQRNRRVNISVLTPKDN